MQGAPSGESAHVDTRTTVAASTTRTPPTARPPSGLAGSLAALEPEPLGPPVATSCPLRPPRTPAPGPQGGTRHRSREPMRPADAQVTNYGLYPLLLNPLLL